MVAAALIVRLLGGAASGPRYQLTIAGMSVLKGPAGAGVPLDSIEVKEEGSGGVSSCRFRLEDPSVTFSLAEGRYVEFWDMTLVLPIFSGWVQTWDVEPFALGRAFAVTAIGVEAVLDWMLIERDTTFALGSRVDVAVQTLATQTVGIGYGLNVALSSATNSTQVEPIADLRGVIGGSPAILAAAITISAGTTLREAINSVLELAGPDLAAEFWFPVNGRCTVDFWGGLRLWRLYRLDYDDLTVEDTVAGAIRAADLSHEVDATGVIRGVYIKGVNAAASGATSDGSGIPGPWSYIDDATITTAAQRDARATGYLATFAPSTRGEFRQETFTPTTQVRPGVRLDITDAQVGNVTAEIASIRKVFHGGALESWTIGYGGLRPSLARAVRRLTSTFRR